MTKPKRTIIKIGFPGVLMLMSIFNISHAQTKTEKLDKLIGTYAEYGQFNGTVLVAEKGKIIYVHFRDVLGTVPNFREAFIGEGNLNMFQVMKTLKELNFKGFLIDDHVPRMVGDQGWVSLSRAFANGQMVTMLEVLNSGTLAN